MIYAVGGIPGSGKTYFVVRALWIARRRDPSLPVYSNIPLFLPGAPCGLLEQPSDAYNLRDCAVFFDELHLLLSSRNWARHGTDVSAWVSQLRKLRVTLWYTAQDVSTVDKVVRGQTYVSYYPSSAVGLGFFVYTSYFGWENKKANRFAYGCYALNPYIACAYDTERLTV